MNVEAIRLKNFMAFEDSGWIELRPITLLFGRNSSGKSAVIRALRLLRQSLDPSGRGALQFSSSQGIDLGPYRETVHRLPGQGKSQEGEQPPWQPPLMAFGFRCELPTVLDELWGLLGQYLSNRGEEMPARDYLPKVVEVELVFESTKNDEQARLSEVTIRYVAAGNNVTQTHNVFSALRLREDDAYTFGEEWWFASDLLIANAEMGDGLWSGWGIDTENSFLPRLVPIVRRVADRRQPQHSFVDRLLGEIKSQVAEFLQQIVHLGPIRPEPRRAYAFNRMDLDTLADAGWRGMVRLLTGDVNENAIRQIETWLRDAEFASELLPDRLSTAVDFGVLARIMLKDISGLRVNLADVGFGTSQVIPILLECFTAEPGDTIIIEQPELHLHPAAQADLGDVFIAMSQRGVCFLIETHSEHLLLRLQKQIAKTTIGDIDPTLPGQKLLPIQAAVYFVNRRGKSTITQVKIGPYGDLLTNPDGFEDFFSDDAIETAERVRARLAGVRKGG